MTSPEQELAAARDAMRSMEEQLVALYAERDEMPNVASLQDVASLQETADSLNAQVCALLDEKLELERQLAEAGRAVLRDGRRLAAA